MIDNDLIEFLEKKDSSETKFIDALEIAATLLNNSCGETGYGAKHFSIENYATLSSKNTLYPVKVVVDGWWY